MRSTLRGIAIGVCAGPGLSAQRWFVTTVALLRGVTALLMVTAPAVVAAAEPGAAGRPPHIVLVMADDMGWGQTGYRGHPLLKTPHLDAMAAAGLRFERFYAGGPVCSPTRAAMLTGRTPVRTGVPGHGHALRLQERSIARALADAGYVTGHFGKWHLDGLRGPGVPVLAGDPRGPAAFGFAEWVSATNFIDLDPLLGRPDGVAEFRGDSSEVVVAEAVSFLRRHRDSGRPLFAVIWYGSPHSPYRAAPADVAAFAGLDEASAAHHGELVALDRSVGTLRAALRDLGLAADTMLVFCSDNGGLSRIEPDTVGGLRGHKASLHEGGIRVPGIIEWPAMIAPRVTTYPACVMDLAPTIAELVGLPADALLAPCDGTSLVPLFTREIVARGRPIGFRHGTARALVDDRFKLFTPAVGRGMFELYDLHADPRESRDVTAEHPAEAARLKDLLAAWDAGVDASLAGRDYPEGRVVPADAPPEAWQERAEYAPFLRAWAERPEYRGVLRRRGRE